VSAGVQKLVIQGALNACANAQHVVLWTNDQTVRFRRKHLTNRGCAGVSVHDHALLAAALHVDDQRPKVAARSLEEQGLVARCHVGGAQLTQVVGAHLGRGSTHDAE